MANLAFISAPNCQFSSAKASLVNNIATFGEILKGRH
jgi:hypothetical protein